MRRLLLTYILILSSCIWVQAQRVTPDNPYGDRVDEFGNVVDRFGNQVDPSTRPDNLDSTSVNIESLPPKLYMWHVSERLGNIHKVAADTAHLNFQNTTLTEGMSGHYNYLANLGSPRLSRVYFDRETSNSTMFIEPYSFFFANPSDFWFTNSNVPFANLAYYKAGNKINGEERFKAYFSVNVNKRLAFGFNIDYLYGRGYYNHSNTSFFNGAPFISYIGKRYEGTLLYNYNYLKMNENGGITDENYIKDPESMSEGRRTYESMNIPTVMNAATNRLSNSYVFLTHRYKLGFEREIPKAKEDTLPPIMEFVPVTSFIHTMKVDWSKRKFTSEDNLKDYYANTFYDLDNLTINDSTKYVGVKNTLGIALLEGFNKYAKAGLTAFVSHKVSKYRMPSQTLHKFNNYTEHELSVGGELAKRQGNTLHYRVTGEVGLVDKSIGEFDVNGDIDVNFKLGKDTVSVIARAGIQNQLPSFYMRHFHSKHFYWDNPNFNKEFKTHIEGELIIERWRTNLKFQMQNIKNYTFLNGNAMPEQFSGNVQIMAASLKQDFKIGIFHLDNEVTWQKSTNEQILPLPDWSIYHNLYIDAKVFKKVLTIQFGADVRYFTKYFAPAYTPAVGMFHLQPQSSEEKQVLIGNYPIVNVYANMHLKRTRFFVMLYNAIDGLISFQNSFYAPRYPINPRLIKFGVSWNFYD